MVIQKPKMNNANTAKAPDYGVKPSSLKKINTIYISVLLLLTLSCFGLLVYPAATKAQQLRLKLKKVEAELNGKLKLEAALGELIKKYQDDLRLAKEVVFTDRDIATFLENFSDFVRQANMSPVSIVSMNIKPVPVSSESEKILEQMSRNEKGDKPKKNMAKELPGLLMKPMEIKIKGEYPDLVNFLISLEEYKQLLTINNLNVQIAREGYPALEASFIILLYTMEPPEANENKEV